jgi:hypothetical protein
MKDLYNESYGTFKKEIKEHTRRWKDLPCSWISKLNIVKKATLLKIIYSMQSVSKFHDMFHRGRKINPKVHINAQKTSNS